VVECQDETCFDGIIIEAYVKDRTRYGPDRAILCILSTPLLLGSGWAMIPALVSVACYVLRTYLEDRMLMVELDGYEVYAQQTRYRLLPGVW
jgi:hypothetical protein